MSDDEFERSQEAGAGKLDPSEANALWSKISQQQVLIEAQSSKIDSLAAQVSSLVSLLGSGIPSSSQASGSVASDSQKPAPSLQSGSASAADPQKPVPVLQSCPGAKASEDPDPMFESLIDAVRRREAPPPEVFSLESGRSFDRFLVQFERYCQSKFSEDSREGWTGELGRYLQGELLSVFKVFGGGDVDLSVMIQRLKDHYGLEKRKAQSDRLRQFLTASPKADEPTYLYAYRLERLYQKAHPGSSSDDLSLQARLLGSIPPTEAVTIQQELDILKCVTGSDTVAWDSIVSVLRRKHDRQRLTVDSNTSSKKVSEPVSSETKIWFTSDSVAHSSLPMTQDVRARSSSVDRVRSFVPRGQTPSNRGRGTSAANRNSRQDSRACDWCGISGHLYKDCWRRLGLCLRCGSEQHLIRNCPVRRNPSSSLEGASAGGRSQFSRPARAQSLQARSAGPGNRPPRSLSAASRVNSDGSHATTPLNE